ncbi:MAG: adenylate/guanylate cyclase domain-containing protein, partial [Bacteroidota bacterium]
MRECPKCLHLNPPLAKFCNNCGAALNEQVVQAATPRKSKRAAERRQLTILFCDLVGSTSLSEQLDPEEYRQVIIDYHELAEKVIQQFGGHIAQYLGDGLLVYFGYPKGLEDAPRSAVRAGLGILSAVEKANKTLEQAGKTVIAVRIGIHSGLVVVDDHLALGETVNVAARLEGLAPHNGLVISPQTLKLTKGWFSTNSLGLHTLKGISKPMEVFQVLQESGAKTRLDIAKSQGLSPLVGRTKEIGLLTNAWQKAKEGNGNLCLLKGEAGIGKSRLVDKMEQQTGQESASLIIEARCSAYHQQSAFYPFIQLLEKDILRFNQQDTQTAKLTKLENLVLEASLNFQPTMRLLAEFLSIKSDQFPPLAISPLAKKQRTTESLNQLI